MMSLVQLLRVRAAAFHMAELRLTGQIVCKVVSSRTEVADTLRTDLRTFAITLGTAVTMVLWLLW